MINSTDSPTPDSTQYNDRDWKEYRHVKDFLENPGSLRRHAETLGVSPSAWAFMVCKYAPSIYKNLQEKTDVR